MGNETNTGKSIQTMGNAVKVIGIIISIIEAILLWILASDSYEEEVFIVLGFVCLIVGIISSVVLGTFITGFGELVENSQKTASDVSVVKMDSTDTKKIVMEINATLKGMKYNNSATQTQATTTKQLSTNEIIAQQAIAMQKTDEAVKEKKSQESQMWKCPKCNNFNFANSNECMNCHTKVKFK